MDGSLIDALDLPALLSVNPGVCLGLVLTTHTTHDTTAQADTQCLQRNTLQDRLKEALHDDTFGLRARNATHHQIEELLFVDLTTGGSMTGAHLVGRNLQTGDELRTCLLTQQQAMR